MSKSTVIHRLLNRTGKPLGVNPFPRTFDNPLAQREGAHAKVFDAIYKENYWGSAESRSGVGSERAATIRYRADLTRLLRARSLRRVFDALSGDLNWIIELVRSGEFEYSGGDISEEVVRHVHQLHPDVRVSMFDITLNPFPAADVWHCRDCLFHLPFAYVRKALVNFASSSIPWVLMTSHRSRLLHRNLDVRVGGFRYLDLEKPPFSLPTPEARLRDYRYFSDFPRYVCLWSREQIAASIA